MADLFHFGQAPLIAAGLAEERARDVAEVLLEGDLLGHNTHGFALLPLYLQALEDDSMERQSDPLVIADHGSALTWDGCQLINPDRFGGRAAFLRDTGSLVRLCAETPATAGKPPVRLPGQDALARRRLQLADGVELHPTILPALVPWAEKLNARLRRQL